MNNTFKGLAYAAAIVAVLIVAVTCGYPGAPPETPSTTYTEAHINYIDPQQSGCRQMDRGANLPGRIVRPHSNGWWAIRGR